MTSAAPPTRSSTSVPPNIISPAGLPASATTTTKSTQGGAWLRYVAAWAHEDLAVPSWDRMSTYAFSGSSAESTLKVTAFDGFAPSTEKDRNVCDLTPYGAGDHRRASGSGAPPTPSLRPIAAIALENEGEGERLLVLLSSGLLLLLDGATLTILASLGMFPDIDSKQSIGSPIAVIKELGWVAVAENSRLGFAPLDGSDGEGGGEGQGQLQHHSSAGGAGGAGASRPLGRSVELPKGCFATALAGDFGGETMLVAGCSNGRMLVYSVSIVHKGPFPKVSLNLLQTLDISGHSVSMAATGLRSKLRGLMGMNGMGGGAGTATTLSGGGLSGVIDVTYLPGTGGLTGGILGVCGAGGGSGDPGNGMMSLWTMATQSWRESASGSSGTRPSAAALFRHLAGAHGTAPIFRLVLIPPGRLASASAVALTLDAFGEIALRSVHGSSGLELLLSLPGHTALEISAARTFAFSGSLHLLAARGRERAAQIGWLDLACVLEAASLSGAALAPPCSARFRSCLGPPAGLIAGSGPSGASSAASPLVNGGEVFFVSQSELRCYRAVTGRSSTIAFSNLPAGCPSGRRVLQVLDVFAPPDSTSRCSHILLGMLELESGNLSRSAWIVTCDGEFLARMPGALDAVFLAAAKGQDPREGPRVAWLAAQKTSGSNELHLAPSIPRTAPSLALASTATRGMPGIDRIISGPCSERNMILFWGSRLPGGPLRVGCGDGTTPCDSPCLEHPLLTSRPLELVDAQWSQSQSCHSLAVACTSFVMVLHVSAYQAAAAGAGVGAVLTSGIEGSQAPLHNVNLTAWIDLRTVMMGAGRALSLAWLADDGEKSTLLISTPSGISWWSARSCTTPKALVSNERPQLLLGALIDRLLTLEMHTGPSVFVPPNLHTSMPTSRPGQVLPPGPRTRVRARPVSYMEALLASGGPRHGGEAYAASVASACEGAWRLAPPNISGAQLPVEVAKRLWPAAACAEGPPQLLLASTFTRCALANPTDLRGSGSLLSSMGGGGPGSPSSPSSSSALLTGGSVDGVEAFRGLTSLVSGLQSSLPRSRRGDGSAEENKASERVEEAILVARSNPSRIELMHAASQLLLECSGVALSAGAGEGSTTGLAIAARGIAKHDLLPPGALFSALVEGVLQRPDLKVLLGSFDFPCVVLPDAVAAGAAVGGRPATGSVRARPAASSASSSRMHWSRTLATPAALVDEVVSKLLLGASSFDRSQKFGLAAATGAPSVASSPDFSAQALLQQQYLESPPQRRVPQVVQASGQAICQLHTATLHQWLGLASTELQIRVFQALQQEEDTGPAGLPGPLTSTTPGDGHDEGAESSGWPTTGQRDPRGPSQSTARPSVMANGILAYWRCSDGDGSELRDCAGAGRVGQLKGDVVWFGPLPAEEPMETSDDWGSSLAPNFSITLGPDSKVTYSANQGSAGLEDRQLLALLGASSAERAAGERLLKRAVEDANDTSAANAMQAAVSGDSKGSNPAGGGPKPGWTVECWLRLSENFDASKDYTLFSRSAAEQAPSIAWIYRGNPAGFSVKGGAHGMQTFLAGPVAPLAEQEWIHIALRCDLKQLEVWVQNEIVLTSDAGAALPNVPLDASIALGPGAGLELTEIRLWGAFRSNLDLMEQQQRPLATMLPTEKKADALRRVRIRAATTPAQQDFSGGLWSLPDLLAGPSATGTTVGRGGRRRGGAGNAGTTPSSNPFDDRPGWGGDDITMPVARPTSAKTTAVDFMSAGIGGEGSEVAAFPGIEGASAVTSFTTWPMDDGALAPAPFGGSDEPIPSESPFQVNTPAAGFPSAFPGTATADFGAVWGPFEEPSPSPTPGPGPSPAPTPASVAAATGPIAVANPLTPSESNSSLRSGQSQSQAQSRLGSRTEQQRRTSDLGTFNEQEGGSESSRRSQPPELPKGSSRPHLASLLDVLPPIRSTEHRPNYGEDFHSSNNNNKKTDEGPGSPYDPHPSPSKPLSVLERAVVASDAALRVACAALERGSTPFAAATFRAGLAQLRKPIEGMSPEAALIAAAMPVRARFEAIATYLTLCTLLEECQKLQMASVKNQQQHLQGGQVGPGDAAGGPPSKESLVVQLCRRWCCIMRLGKAPKHTVHYAIQAMAVFFSLGREVGGWSAAHQVASMLLQRCSMMLSSEEFEQVSYVESATVEGSVARGAYSSLTGGSEACGRCPCCRRLLDALSPHCSYCGAELAVCFKTLSICDGGCASQCTLCGAVASGTTGLGLETYNRKGAGFWSQIGLGSNVKSSRCFICNLGELRTHGALMSH